MLHRKGKHQNHMHRGAIIIILGGNSWVLVLVLAPLYPTGSSCMPSSFSTAKSNTGRSKPTPSAQGQLLDRATSAVALNSKLWGQRKCLPPSSIPLIPCLPGPGTGVPNSKASPASACQLPFKSFPTFHRPSKPKHRHTQDCLPKAESFSLPLGCKRLSRGLNHLKMLFLAEGNCDGAKGPFLAIMDHSRGIYYGFCPI